MIVEPRLTSTLAYYVVSDPAVLAALCYSYPGSSDAPTIEIRNRPGYEGLQGRVLLDFGCGFADYRGIAKNAGE